MTASSSKSERWSTPRVSQDGALRLRQLVAQATRVFSSQQEGARWFRKPAIGLGSRRPIDLVWTFDGMRQIETLLDRIDSGVYT